jgi:YHS domain-containing protein
MLRAFIELVITILVVMVARAILTSFLKASAKAFQTRDAAQHRPADQPPPDPARNAPAAGELHKDPVCGTYVAESTPFRRNIGAQTFYYCSDACREKHALVAR